jgi:hypothetical protein
MLFSIPNIEGKSLFTGVHSINTDVFWLKKMMNFDRLLTVPDTSIAQIQNLASSSD